MSGDTRTKRKLVRMQRLRHAIDRLRHAQQSQQGMGRRSLLTRIKDRLNVVLGKNLPEEE